MMPSEDSIMKITGDIADEASEAGIRLMATVIVKKAVDFLTEDNLDDDTIKTFLDKKNPMGEAVVGFALAAIFELTPISSLGDVRQRLAYNLRVRSYEEAGELVLRKLGPRLFAFKKFAIEQAENVRDWVKGDLQLDGMSKSKSDGAAEREDYERDVARMNTTLEAMREAMRKAEEKVALEVGEKVIRKAEEKKAIEAGVKAIREAEENAALEAKEKAIREAEAKAALKAGEKAGEDPPERRAKQKAK
jgi:hypothetical protein